MEHTYTKEDLIHFQPKNETFVGIDSDGCIFDTMEVKQKKFFHTKIIEYWELQAIEAQLRKAAEFVNLYSKWRGSNRFIALLKTFDLLADWPDVTNSGIKLPETDALREYVESGIALSNATLQQCVEEKQDPELKRLLEWSLDVNRFIAAEMGSIPPFKWVEESLKKIQASSDAIVVSQTPEEALVREWEEHGMAGYISIIAGQELGTKTEHLQMACGGKYPGDKILMIGDAPGDRKAAQANNAFFYPIQPGQEEASWKRFAQEAYDKFLDGSFAGDYQQQLINEFEAALPETPPWKA